MCVYLFSPERKLQVEYASESITLLQENSKTDRPSTDVVLDLLLTNKSEGSDIETVYFIYPRAFFSCEYDNKNKIVLDDISVVADETTTFLDRTHPYNRFLMHFPCNIETSEEAPGRFVMRSTQPDPSSPGDTVTYNGYLNAAGVQVEPMDGLTDSQWYILMNLGKNFTPFMLRFNEPIRTQEARWVRLHITYANLYVDLTDFVKHWKDKALDRLVGHYHIIGCYDVIYQLRSYLKAFIINPTSKPVDKKLVFEAGNLLRKLHELTERADVSIVDWRIHVFTMNYWELSDISFTGDVVPAGDFPNILFPLECEFESQICYQWKTGEKYVPPGQQTSGGKFHISFRVKDPNYLYRLLPWIALIVGLTSWFI